MNLGRAGLESLETLLARLVRLVVEEQFAWFLSLFHYLALSIDEVDGESLRVFHRHDISAAGRRLHFFHSIGQGLDPGELKDLFEVFSRFHLECATLELFGSLFGVVNVLVGSVSSIPSFIFTLFDHMQSKICQTGMRVSIFSEEMDPR